MSRTGGACRKGCATTFFLSSEDERYALNIVKFWNRLTRLFLIIQNFFPIHLQLRKIRDLWNLMVLLHPGMQGLWTGRTIWLRLSTRILGCKPYGTDLEISDLSQNVRWKITHEETVSQISERTGAALRQGANILNLVRFRP